VELWKARDPIPAFGKRLVEEGVVSRDDLECLQAKARTVVKEAVIFAEESPWPDDGEVWKDIYAGEEEVCPWQK
jgi:pyruvate dehydrogenase E1 component alpha subunit